MLLLADTNQITVIVLCIAALIFIFADIFLVFSLNKQNKRLAKKGVIPLENELTSPEMLDAKNELLIPETLDTENELPAPQEESKE